MKQKRIINKSVKEIINIIKYENKIKSGEIEKKIEDVIINTIQKVLYDISKNYIGR